MPIAIDDPIEEQKRRELIALGLDPNQYDLVDTEQSITKQAPVATRDNNALDAFLTGARRNIGGTAGGIGGAAAGLKLGALAGGSIGSVGAGVGAIPGATVGGLLGALAGGFGGAFLGGKGQEIIEPKIRSESPAATQLRLEQEQKLAEQHPVASFSGELAPSLVAFRPSPTALKNAALGLVNKTRMLNSKFPRVQLPLAQKAALANSAINAAISGSSSAISELLDEDEDFNAKRVLGHTAVGALLNEPTFVGRALGFTPTPTGSATKPINRNIPIEQEIGKRRQLTTGVDVKNLQVSSASNPIITPYEGEFARAQDFIQARQELRSNTEPGETTIKSASVDEAKPVSANTLKITKPAIERRIAEQQVPSLTVKDTTDTSDFTGNIQKANEEIANEPKTLAEEIQERFDKYQPRKASDEKPVPVGAAIRFKGVVYKGKDHGDAFKKAVEFGGFKPTDDLSQLEDGLVDQFGKFYTREESYNKWNRWTSQGLSTDEFYQKTLSSETSGEPTSKATKTLTLSEAEADLVAREGINVRAGRVFNDQGIEQAGVARVGSPNREVKISPSGRREDTVYHEVAHHRLQELISNPKTAKSAKRLLAHFEGDEEALIQSTGEQYNQRVKEFGVMGALRNFYKDFVGGVRGDADRILSAKLRYDAPFSERLAARDFALKTTPVNLNEPLKELTPEQISYKGFQPGYGKIPGFNLYNVEVEGLHPQLPKGTTISDQQLNALGFKTPDSIITDKGGESKFQTQEEQSVFYNEAPKIAAEKADKKAPANQSWNFVKNRITPIERDLYEQAGIEQWLKDNPKANGAELQDWLTENQPKLEVHSYGMEGKVSEAKREYDRMTHEWYDGLDAKRQQAINYATADVISAEPQPYNKWPQHIRAELATMEKEKVAKYVELVKQVENEPLDTSPRATSAYETVSAFPANEPMPEWTTSKEGKNVQRVDVVIPTKYPKENYKRYEELGAKFSELNSQEYTEWTALHNKVSKKPIKWRADNLHENLHNTLGWAMIQYKTGPNGEKIALIVEAQSRWGQQIREEIKVNASMPKEHQATEEQLGGHPLLRDYNRLILKAAIAQAKKEGATHIMISDAETAMMTEGHDLVRQHNRDEAQALVNRGQFNNLTDAINHLIENGRPSQEPGMRFNYDTALPRIAKELTGSEGERVSLGEHKNAYAEQYDNAGGLVRGGKTRDNLIFRNPDSTPKTDITGRLYPIAQTPESYSTTRARYQSLQTGVAEVDSMKPGIERSDSRSIASRIVNRLNPFNLLKGEVAKIAEIEPKDLGISASEQITKQRVGAREREGQFRDIADTFIELKAPQRDLLYKVVLAENEHQRSFKEALPVELRDAYDKWRAALASIPEVQNSLGEKVREYVKQPDGTFKIELRERKINPFYAPNVISAEAAEALTKPGSELYNKLKQDLIEHYIKHYKNKESGKRFATEAFNDFTKFEGHGGDSVKFGPNRKAEGIGLPQSWIERDPVSAMRRYLRRTANDLSFFEHIENQPIMAQMFGIKYDQYSKKIPEFTADGKHIPDLSGNESVRNIKEIITGQAFSKTPALDAAIGIVNSMLLGPVGGVADFTSVPFNVLKLVPSATDVPRVITNGFKNIKQGLEHSMETGLNKKDPIILRDLFLPTSRLAQKLTSARDFIYRVQGRKQLEIWSRALSQSMGEEVIALHAARARAGDKNAQAFLKKMLGSKVDFNNIDMKKAGSMIAEVMQGTYDFRNLPIWAIDGNIAPIFRLARWSIEQTNNWFKYVWEPATKGNVTPLFLSTLGAVAGGALIKQLRETLNDKKSYTPTLTELVHSSRGVEGNIPQVAYQLLALSTYTGYAGIIGDLARSSLDVVLNKNRPQSVDFPFWGAVSDSTERILQALQAIVDGEGDYIDVASKLTTDILKQNLQMARLAQTWGLENTGLRPQDKAEKERKEKFRDLRAFKQVEGLPVSPMTESASNPYANRDIKEFKRSSDLREAKAQVPSLIAKAKAKSQGSREELKRNLSTLRRNQYTTVPSPTTSPREFKQYFEFIARTQGSEKAIALLRDYYRQQAINRAKSRMIPQLP